MAVPFFEKADDKKPKIHGDENSVPISAISDWLACNSDVILSYAKKDIYNCDEKGLYNKANKPNVCQR